LPIFRFGWRFQGWLLFLLETDFAVLPPSIELGTQDIDGASLLV
jgi:hypothetical protein